MGWRVSRAAILALLLVLLGGCGSAGSTSGSGSHSTTTSRLATTIGVVSRVPVGKMPVFAAEDPNTHTLYVTNAGDDTVSVIRTAGCNGHHASRCAAHWPVVGVGHLPLGLAVAQATDTVYVANAKDGTVSVINGATCNGSDGSGCRQKPTTVPVGAFGDSVAVDPVSDMVFVTNQDARPGTVSVIDGHACNGRHPAGCADQPFMTVDVGSGPSGIDVNPVTNTIYVANTAEDSNNTPLPHGSTLSVIDGATCKPTDRSGCTPVGTVRVGADPANLAVDPATNTVYVANTFDNTNSGTGTVSSRQRSTLRRERPVRLRFANSTPGTCRRGPCQHRLRRDDQHSVRDQRQGQDRIHYRRRRLQRDAAIRLQRSPTGGHCRRRSNLCSCRHRSAHDLRRDPSRQHRRSAQNQVTPRRWRDSAAGPLLLGGGRADRGGPGRPSGGAGQRAWPQPCCAFAVRSRHDRVRGRHRWRRGGGSCWVVFSRGEGGSEVGEVVLIDGCRFGCRDDEAQLGRRERVGPAFDLGQRASVAKAFDRRRRPWSPGVLTPRAVALATTFVTYWRLTPATSAISVWLRIVV